MTSEAAVSVAPAGTDESIFDRVSSMATTAKTIDHPADGELPHPMDQDNAVWQVLPRNHVGNTHFSRRSDKTGILDDLSVAIGPPTAMCVLGDNIIGAADWAKIPLALQYEAVTRRAGAFVASNMLYLRVRGTQAAAALDWLTPRDISRLPVGRGMFVLFTNESGGIDEEAIVLRTAPEEYLLSCGGGKPPSLLAESLARHPQAYADECELVSFNLKGPQRLRAMQSLVCSDHAREVMDLKPFEGLQTRTPTGDPVWILRTVVGVEMWGPAPVIRHTWQEMLRRPQLITPCAWDLLNIFRMECTAMVFAVYPLDLHAGTSLWESGYGWMIEKGGAEEFAGQQALTKLRGKERLWLGGLMALDHASVAPPLGATTRAANGNVAGYVTSAAISIKYRRALAFAHLSPACKPGDTLTLDGSDRWQVCTLPFTGPGQD